MSKVGTDINNMLCKNSQLHFYDFNRYIFDIVIENFVTTSIIPSIILIIILTCAIAIITIPLILYVLPEWIRINGRPLLPGPYQDLKTPYWKDSPRPKPMEPAVKPSGPNPAPFPLKDPGKGK
jgi:hypothetical protein